MQLNLQFIMIILQALENDHDVVDCHSQVYNYVEDLYNTYLSLYTIS